MKFLLPLALALLALGASPRAARAQFTPAQLDSLRAATQPPAPAPQRLDACSKLLFYYSLLPNLDSTRHYASRLTAPPADTLAALPGDAYRRWQAENSLGNAHGATNQIDSALAHFLAAQAIAQDLYRQTPPASPQALRIQKSLNISTASLAGQYGQAGEHARADSIYATLIAQAVADGDTLAQIRYLANQGVNRNGLALRTAPKDSAAAISMTRAAIEAYDAGIHIARQYLALHPDDIRAQQPFLMLLTNRSKLILARTGSREELQAAMELLVEALNTARVHKLPGRFLITPTLGLARLLQKLERYDKALAESRRVMAEATALGLRSEVALSHQICAEAHWGLRQPQAALQAHQAAVAIYLEIGDTIRAENELSTALQYIADQPRHERRALREARRDLAAQAAQLRAARSPTP